MLGLCKNDKKELKRKNIHMSVEIAEWYEKESFNMGISTSALMVMALKQYIDSQAALKFAGNIQDLVGKVEHLQSLSLLQDC